MEASKEDFEDKEKLMKVGIISSPRCQDETYERCNRKVVMR